MAIQTRTTIKNWFKRGLKPLEIQFADWIDSFWHKSDTIAISDISGLQTALDDLGDSVGFPGTSETIANGGTITVAAGEVLELMLVESASSQVVKCGTSAGDNDIFGVSVGAGGNYLHREDFAPSSTLTLHFTTTSNITLKLKRTTFA